MSIRLKALVPITCLLASAGASASEEPSAEHPVRWRPVNEERVDALFAQWSKPDTPGCAVGVLKDGRMTYSRGYGMADLEHDVPITTQSVFHIASTSKQFTAFAIHLLAHEGKLSLDDDVRKYVSELPDFGKTITIRHLLHHTSGLRDVWFLLALAGWRFEDVMTEGDLFNFVLRQRALNFAPGEDMGYNNFGYTLLGWVVSRVSGKSLRQFTQERLFTPLGMQHTQFQDDFGRLIKNHVQSYRLQEPGIYRHVAVQYMAPGSTSLLTTVEDLATWDANFYNGKVGGATLLTEFQTRGRLNSGEEIPYASGLFIDEYRGLKIVEHGGVDGGYRTNLLRFPEQHFSVILLCNAAEADPTVLTRRVADIYLEQDFKSEPEKSLREIGSATREVRLSAKAMDAYIGDYELPSNVFVTFTRQKSELTMEVIGQRVFPLKATSKTSFFLKDAGGQVIFDYPAKDGRSMGFTMHQDDGDRRAKRIAHERPTTEQLQNYAGTFYSDEINTIYTVTADEGRLSVAHPRGVSSALPATLTAFISEFGALQYQCPQAGLCSSFTVSNDRVRNLRFNRVHLNPVVRPNGP